MAIDDNTVYGLTGAQIKELPEKIEAVKGLAKVLTAADYNANSSNWSSTDSSTFNCIALWRLPSGVYVGDGSVLPAYAVRTRNGWLSGATIAIVKQEISNSDRGTVMFVNGDTLSSSAIYTSIYNDGTSYNRTPFPLQLANYLTAANTGLALDATQGKVLNDKIGGDLSNLTTTDKTSLINAINELAGQSGGGGVTELTSADYNYPTNNPTYIGAWLLPPGFYTIAEEGVNIGYYTGSSSTQPAGYSFTVLADEAGTSVNNHKVIISPYNGTLYIVGRGTGSLVASKNLSTAVTSIVDRLTSTSSTAALSANQGKVLKDLIDSIAIRGAGAPTTSTVGEVGQLYEDGTNGALYQLKSIDITVTPNTYNWEQVGGSSYTAGDGIDITNNEISATNTGKAKVLTTADYNYPTDNPTYVALWLLEPGVYYKTTGVNTRYDTTSGSQTVLSNTRILIIGGDITTTHSLVAIDNDRVITSTLRADGGSQSGYPKYFLNRDDIVDALTSSSVTSTLSANQGRVLKSQIGDLTALDTTAQTDLVSAINEVAAGGGGGITELTSADYNYPTDNPTSVAHWLLTAGTYLAGEDIAVSLNTGSSYTVNKGGLVTIDKPSSSTSRVIYTASNNSVYMWVTDASGNTSGVNKSALWSNNVSQSTGTSTTNVMSQNAVTKMIYPRGDTSSNPAIVLGNIAGSSATDQTISIGWTNTSNKQYNMAFGYYAQATGSRSIAIGDHTVASGNGSVALASYSSATTAGEMNIGSSNTSYGYNSSNYRLLTGLYDPQNAHDAANKEYVDAANSYSTTEVATGGTWVDGSTIYKKTISFGALPNSSSKSVAHGITNLSRVVKFECVGYRSTDSDNFPIPIAFSGTDVIRPLVTPTNIDIETTAGRSSINEVYVTLYYTKSS